MAKIIKCPKCGENVEIPANAAGTVVKCGACGAGLRIKARQPAGGGAGGEERGQGSMSGSLSGSVSGSMSGTVIGQTGYGQPAAESDPDGPPSLGSECAVCGRSVSPDELIEDRGQLVCTKCAKRPARGGAAVGAGAPAMAPEPSFDPALRHGPMIRMNAAFMAGCAALAIAAAAQAFLYFNPKPAGTRIASVTPVKKSTTQAAVSSAQSWEDQNRAEIVRRIEEAQQLALSDEKAAMQKYDELGEFIRDQKIEDEALRTMLAKVQADRADLEKKLVAEKSADQPATMAAVPEPTSDVPEPETKPAGPAEPQATTEPPKPDNIFYEPPPGVPEPLVPALKAIAEKRYDDALAAIRDIRPSATASRDQRLTYEVLGAANLGGKRYGDAESQLVKAGTLYASEGVPPTRSLVVNRAMAQLARSRPALAVAKDIQAYLRQAGGQPPDEATHAVLGTAVSRIDQNPKIKAERDELVNLLASYTQQLDSTKAPEGQRRWGTFWADAKMVEDAQAHAARLTEEMARLEVELNKRYDARVAANFRRDKQAMQAADKAYDETWNEVQERKRELAKYQPQWLTKWEPVVPEVQSEDAGAPPPVPTPETSPPPVPAPANEPPPVPEPAPPPPPVPTPAQ